MKILGLEVHICEKAPKDRPYIGNFSVCPFCGMLLILRKDYLVTDAEASIVKLTDEKKIRG